MTLTRAFHFRAAHSIGHGHEYRVEITLRGDLDRQSGLLNVRKYFSLLEKEIIKPLNNSTLNTRLAVTSGERICHYIFKECENRVPEASLKQVALQQTFNNRFIVTEELLSI